MPEHQRGIAREPTKLETKKDGPSVSELAAAVHSTKAPPQPTNKHDQLLGRLREIGFGPGDLDARLQAAEAAVLGERHRFPASDAGRIQWNWYTSKFATEIRYERDRLELSARKRMKPGEPASGPLLELFSNLQPRILGLREPWDEPIPLAEMTDASLAAKKN